MLETHPVRAAVNRAGEPATFTVSTEPVSGDLGRRPPMGETRLSGTAAMQTQTPAQPMRVQYDLASGQSYLTPIRGEDAPPVPHTDPVYHSHDTQEEGTLPRLLSANNGYARGGGSYTYLPAILWATRDCRARPHSPGRPSGGGQINGGQPFFVLNLDGGGDKGSVPYSALDKALVEAARGRMPLIYGPPATFVLPQGLPTPEQLGKNKVPEAQVAAVDTTWRKAVQNGTPTDKLAAFQALAELVRALHGLLVFNVSDRILHCYDGPMLFLLRRAGLLPI